MPPIGVLLLLIHAICTESSTKADNAQVTNTYFELLKLSKNITKRESGCPEGQQREGSFCCRPCLPGERKRMAAKLMGTNLSVSPARKGRSTRTRNIIRLHAEDVGFVMESMKWKKNCTKTQNTKCRCKSNYFCNTPPCEHCNPCSTCEHGIIEDCTPTNDRRCKAGSTSHLHLLWLLVLVPIAAAFIVWRVKRQRRNNNLPLSEPTSPETEMLPVISPDIDLTDYISTIAELMTISEVRDFVRKNGLKEAKIDEIKNDNLQNTAEQKVQLLRNWYQVHGKKDAFTTLITGLKRIKLCAHADKIQDIVLNDITSKRENTNITNENESQRLV